MAVVLLAIAVAAAAGAVLLSRRHGSRQPAPAPPRVLTVEEEEREGLLAEVGDEILERLDDGGLWLPNGTSVDTLYVPVEQVGGDFLCTLDVDGEAVAFIGDVAGHGLDAAIVALRVKEAVAEAIGDGASLDEAIGRANDLLRAEVPGFATMFACRVGGDGELSFVNAGHVPPLVVEGAPPDELAPTGPMMGAVEHDYELARVQVDPATRLVAYTDGVTEAFGARGGLSQPEIRDVVSRRGHIADLRDAVVAKLDEPVRDDIAAFELTLGDTKEVPPGA